MTSTIHFLDDDFQFGFETALGASYRQSSDVGEVLATAGRIKDGDSDSWLHEWTVTAGALWSAAIDAERSGRKITALAHYRRAATYYAIALRRIAQSTEPERQLDIWRRQRACWERIVELSPQPGERLEIPYQDTTLPGYLFRAPDAAPGEPRPVVVINNGTDAPISQLWAQGGAAAGERGYHWMTFDGPGHGAMLYERGLTLRPDWEAVLTPVVDVLTSRGDVDPEHIAAIGIDQAGYLTVRALCFEHRLAAAISDPGIIDLLTPWTDQLPAHLHKMLTEQRRTAFDREMHLTELFSPATAATLRFRAQPYVRSDSSRYRLYQTIAQYHLGREIEQITTPLLVTDRDDAHRWPGQPRQLHDRLPGPKTIIEQAGRHVEPGGTALRETRIFDWLDRHLNH